MPFASVWSVMFFLMLITVGIDTEFGMLEGVVTPVIDQKLFPKLRKEYISGKGIFAFVKSQNHLHCKFCSAYPCGVISMSKILIKAKIFLLSLAK